MDEAALDGSSSIYLNAGELHCQSILGEGPIVGKQKEDFADSDQKTPNFFCTGTDKCDSQKNSLVCGYQ
jgi:hypothetical protein